MTDNEIIKALERIASWVCDECKFHGEMCDGDKCEKVVAENALNLINRQKEEVEKCKKKANTPFAKVTFDENKLKEIVSDVAKNIEFNLNLIKSEAIKEFAERLKENYCFTDRWGKIIPKSTVDNLVKEMTEVNENE